MLNLYFIIYTAWLLLTSHSVRTIRRRTVNSMFVSIDCYYLFIISFICVMLAICTMLYRQIRKHWQHAKAEGKFKLDMSDPTKDSLVNCSMFKNSGIWYFFFHPFSEWCQRDSAGGFALVTMTQWHLRETYVLMWVL